MLILTRRVGEKLIIDLGDRVVEVMPLGIKGNQVRIGIEADKGIGVHRIEIWDKIQKEKMAGRPEGGASIGEIKNAATKELEDALPDSPRHFKVIVGDTISEDPGEYASIEYAIEFEFGNCKHSHSLVIGWNADDGIGLEYGEDGDIDPITSTRLMTDLYCCLALAGLDDKYLR